MFAASSDFEVSAKYLYDLFSSSIEYSPNGSNNRTKEEAILFYWSEYLEKCSQDSSKVSLGDVLKFFSGSSKVPASGFDKYPSIKFTDVDCLPIASTCDVSITFPRKIGLLAYEDFCDRMDFCIQGSYGFGRV